MLRKILCALSALALSACSLPALMGLPAAPVAAANQTVMDEKVGIAIETAYPSAAYAATLAIRSGALSRENILRVAEIDRRAYAAVQATRAAYDAGNASTYREAATIALPLVRELIAAIRGDTP